MNIKVTVEIECTPEEARETWGVADPKPIQQAITTQVVDHIETVGQWAPATLVRLWTNPWAVWVGGFPRK